MTTQAESQANRISLEQAAAAAEAEWRGAFELLKEAIRFRHGIEAAALRERETWRLYRAATSRLTRKLLNDARLQ